MADEQALPTEDAIPAVAPTTDPAKDPTKERIDAFIEGYGELVNKHSIDFASYPVFIPDGTGGFKIIVQNTPVDISNQPKKSPFVMQ